MRSDRCHRPRRVPLLLGIAISLGLSACVTSRVEEFMTEQPSLDGLDSIVILTNRQDAVVEAEKSFSECLFDEMMGNNSELKIISEPDFKNAMFPWFESRLAPTRADGLNQLMAREAIAQRVEDLNIKYLIWIHGESEMLNKQGMMSCTLSPAGGGCVGILSWDNNSDYEATIWDIKQRRSLGIISSEATGTSVVPAVGLPIPLIARTKSASCKSLARQLSDSLSG